MTLSVRQWIVLFVLIAGFGIAALVVRGDGDSASSSSADSSSEFDAPLWCSGAKGLVGIGDLFTGAADDATATDFERAKRAIFDVENAAPQQIHRGLARIADLAHVTKEQFSEFSWPEALAAARVQVNEPEVDQALADLDVEMRLCGLQLGS